MPLQQFIEKSFRRDSLAIIESADAIITDYQEQGFSLTLRQLYYQFVARGLLPNRQSEYKRLGSIINDARLAGLIDWYAIEDRTRFLRSHPSWADPADIIRNAARGFALDLWEGQEFAPEVWVEKDALVGVIEPACNRFRVPYYACRGYSSQSEQWRAGQRYQKALNQGRIPIIFHLGDHDPSGIDMTRDNETRLSMFAREDIEVRRLALNWEQIERYNPPPNPAKETDSRASGYIERFGKSSWELDALDPRVIDRLISSAIESVLDRDAFNARLEDEREHRVALDRAAARWAEVEDFLEQDEG